MAITIRLWFVLIAFAFISGCQSFAPATRAGTAIGGTTGALTGAAIGARQGKSLEGALIGGAVGSLAGGAVGSSIDQVEQRNQLAFQNANYQAQQAAVTVNQLIQMTAGGVNDELIINQIRSMGAASSLNSNDLILLKQNGVSDHVIADYQSARTGGSGYANFESRPTPILVQQPFMAPVRRYGPYRPRFRPPPRCARRGGFGIEIDF